MKEIWKDIPGYQGLYKASNLGRIKSLPRITKSVRNGKSFIRHIKGRIRKPHVHKGDGQVRVSLYRAHGNETNEDLARLIAKTFVPNPKHYPVVLHKDGSKRDNRAVNLYWSSKRQGHVNLQKRKHTSKISLVKNHKKTLFSSMIQAARWIKKETHSTVKTKSISSSISRALHQNRTAIYGYRIIAQLKHKNSSKILCLHGEKWKDITDYEKYYQISNYGRVRRLPTKVVSKNGTVQHYRGRMVKRRIRKGYYYVTLCKNNNTHKYQVHRLVAKAFVPNPHHYHCVNHKDENRSNDKASNLEWCTYKYNNNYGDFSQRIGKANSYPIALKRGSLVLTFGSIYKAACWVKQKKNLSLTPGTIRVKLIYGCRQHKSVYGYNVNYVNRRRYMKNKYTSLIN